MLKRAVDIVASMCGLLVLAPVTLLIALRIKFSDGGPVLYRGRRVGRFGVPFDMLKFRTMVANADRIGGPSTAGDDPRVTPIGRWLRRYKLDELPQLVNVLRGEMSLVGPRPEVQQYVDLFTEQERAILSVRPGITDWASLWNSDEGAVLAGSPDPERTYLEEIRPKKLRLQLSYVRNQSFATDVKVIAQTAAAIVFRKPAAHTAGAGMRAEREAVVSAATIDSYYCDKVDILRDIMGATAVTLERDRVVVDGVPYPIVDGVIILLDRSEYPESLRRRLGLDEPNAITREFADDIQRTFGAEWQRYSGFLEEYDKEFAEYFDIVDLTSLDGKRICDLGCGMGRWSFLLKDRCRELILVDFSDAIFVARRTLRDAPHALFFMGDLTRLPFRSGFADFLFCLGVLHHLPTNALDEVRRLKKYSNRLLIYLYYALDNKPAHFRYLLALVTALRLQLCKIENPRFREVFSWVGAMGIYVPLVILGRLLRPLGLEKYVPLYSEHHWVSMAGHRAHVYDRFFTRIEQRFRRCEILELRDSFSRVLISDNPGYWHFLCER